MQQRQGLVDGLGLGVLSAAAFGTSGSFGASLIDTGWTPGSAVAVRVLLGALVLTVPAVRALRGRWGDLRRGWPAVVAFGLLGVAGAQLAYFSAVQTLSVAVALLLEYSGALMVVVWMWARHGRRPAPLTVGGAAVSVLGLVLVLQVLSGAAVDPVGVLWGLAAAVGLAGYFVVSARTDDALPPLVLAWGGLLVGGAVLLVAGLVGVLSFEVSTADPVLGGTAVPWLVPVAGLGLVAAALCYATGVVAARRLGATVASFVGLTEVLFAVVLAWLLLGQDLAPGQLVGAALVLAGIVAVQADEARRRPAQAPVPEEPAEVPAPTA